MVIFITIKNKWTRYGNPMVRHIYKLLSRSPFMVINGFFSLFFPYHKNKKNEKVHLW